MERRRRAAQRAANQQPKGDSGPVSTQSDSSEKPAPSLEAEAPPPEDFAQALNPNKEESAGLIQVDIPRTFPSLRVFDKGGPLFEPLQHILETYVVYRPDVGYVQGMSFLAGMLLLNIGTCDGSAARACVVSTLTGPRSLSQSRTWACPVTL